MGYKTVKGQAIGEYEEKKSLFIGAVARVESEEKAREFINRIRAEHREAKHNVYAYSIGKNCEIQRYSDDGEPQGTGGIPVLEIIKKNNITDVVVVVTRYFGGVLLGAAGLVRAYSKAAALAVKEAGTIEKVNGLLFKIQLDYDLHGKVEYTFNKNHWQIVDTEYSHKVVLSILCEKEKAQEIKTGLVEITNNKFLLLSQEEGIYFKEDDGTLVMI
ncbi:YigZ family protein [Clostridium thermarum]|uniref:YigZ family protein n=1 Tax=Clostridium thermarum TaxID=1716543 RepID=UPI0013D3BCBB|nr:YigZ family protein [Clostridium thermarum]